MERRDLMLWSETNDGAIHRQSNWSLSLAKSRFHTRFRNMFSYLQRSIRILDGTKRIFRKNQRFQVSDIIATETIFQWLFSSHPQDKQLTTYSATRRMKPFKIVHESLTFIKDVHSAQTIDRRARERTNENDYPLSMESSLFFGKIFSNIDWICWRRLEY